MKQLICTLPFVLFSTLLFSQFTLINQAENEITLTFQLDDYKLSNNKIVSSNGVPILKEGYPELLKFNTSIIIDNYKNTQVEIANSTYEIIENVEINPSKGIIYRNTNPNSVQVDKADVYSYDAFYPASIVTLSDPFNIRSVRGQVINVTPFQYNPVTKQLKVYTEIDFVVSHFTENVENVNDIQLNLTKDFEELIKSHFINYEQSSALMYESLEEGGEMLIISHPNFIDAISDFSDWKLLSGIQNEIVNIMDIGQNATDIKNYIVTYVDEHPNLTYVLLVGDHDYVPSSSTSAGDSDNEYTYLVGDDHYPDLFIGRFSAETTEHVSTMVNRTLEYEKTPSASDTWAAKAVGIGSEDGTESTDINNPPTGFGDNGEADWHHNMNIKQDLLAFTYTDVDELYEGGPYVGSIDEAGNPNSGDLANLINDGIGLINYTGHGSDVSFATTGFDNNDINNLNNEDMHPFIFSVACVNGNFTSQTCFAETWLRANNGDSERPTGAVAVIMSTINQSWNPPMSAQDEMNDILVESYQTNIKRTFGGVTINGCMKMNDDYGDGGSEMTDTWTIFGDPSVMLRTKSAEQMEVNHVNFTPIGTNSISVSCDQQQATICLTSAGEIIALGSSNGGLNTFDVPAITTMDTIFVTITGFNQIPYMGYILPMVAEGPWLTQSNWQLNDADGQADYSENLTVSIELSNVGVETAFQVNSTISCDNSSVTIGDNAHFWGDIINGTATLQNALELTVDDVIDDNEMVTFTMVLTDNQNNSWEVEFSMILHAPVMQIDDMSFNDSNGNGNQNIDMNEWLELQFDYSNIGSSISSNSTITVTSGSSYLTIDNNSVMIGDIASQTSNNVSFDAYVEDDVPLGETAIITVELTNGFYADTEIFYLELNPPTESQAVLGCTDANATNHDPSANVIFANQGGPDYINELGVGGYHYNDSYDLIFDCLKEVTIETIDVYSENSFTVEIEILNSQDNQVFSNQFNLSAGINTLPIEYNLSIGADYKIGVLGNNEGLYRNDNLAPNTYPIPVFDAINITSNTSDNESYYYYFYNWKLSTDCKYDQTWSCFDGTCLDPNDGTGLYTSLNECQQLCTSSIQEIDYTDQLHVYPNPSHGIVNIELATKSRKGYSVVLSNYLGEKMIEKSYSSNQNDLKTTINLQGISAGIYLITVYSDHMYSTKKLIIE